MVAGTARRSASGSVDPALTRRASSGLLHPISDGLGFKLVTKKEARKLLQNKGSLVTVREVPDFGMMMIEPVPF
jgi:hypothetical protein